MWNKEVCRPGRSFPARGRRSGEPTAAYEDDRTGPAVKVKAQTQQGGPRHVDPPKLPKRSRKTRAESAAVVRGLAECGSPGNGGGGGAASRQVVPICGEVHVRKRGKLNFATCEPLLQRPQVIEELAPL